jgi:hypothetical protein
MAVEPRWSGVGKHAAAVILIATVCRFVGWAASVSLAAILDLGEVDHRKNADNTFYIVGCLAIIGAALHLIVAG